MDDLISKRAAIESISKLFHPIGGSVLDEDDKKRYDEGVDDALQEIEELPSAEPRRGKWIKTARWGRVYYCNQCRNYLDFDGVNAGRGSTNFCPNCGADMRGEQDG